MGDNRKKGMTGEGSGGWVVKGGKEWLGVVVGVGLKTCWESQNLVESDSHVGDIDRRSHIVINVEMYKTATSSV